MSSTKDDSSKEHDTLDASSACGTLRRVNNWAYLGDSGIRVYKAANNTFDQQSHAIEINGVLVDQTTTWIIIRQ